MEEIFKVNGFWKNDNAPFKRYLICSNTTAKHLRDDDIFYYGMTEEDVKTNMREAEDNAYEFVITSYKKI